MILSSYTALIYSSFYNAHNDFIGFQWNHRIEYICSDDADFFLRCATHRWSWCCVCTSAVSCLQQTPFVDKRQDDQDISPSACCGERGPWRTLRQSQTAPSLPARTWSQSRCAPGLREEKQEEDFQPNAPLTAGDYSLSALPIISSFNCIPPITICCQLV